MPVTNFDAERAYDDETVAAHKMFRTDDLQVVRGYFEPGQFIPPRASSSSPCSPAPASSARGRRTTGSKPATS
jgi:hypothetical protein